jgi:nicotinamidase-related amidase
VSDIVDDWLDVVPPPPPELQHVTLDPRTTALLVLDIQQGNCNAERRPRCVASLSVVQALLARARRQGVAVLYTLTRRAAREDIRPELAPLPDELHVSAGVDKFHGTELEALLAARNIRAAVLVGTSAHGAVLHTATAAALRGLEVIIPVDGLSASDPYAEQYTSWHLANSPGTRRRAMLTRARWIHF